MKSWETKAANLYQLKFTNIVEDVITKTDVYFLLLLFLLLLGNFLFINFINPKFTSVPCFTVTEDGSFTHSFNKHNFPPKCQSLCKP